VYFTGIWPGMDQGDSGYCKEGGDRREEGYRIWDKILKYNNILSL